MDCPCANPHPTRAWVLSHICNSTQGFCILTVAEVPRGKVSLSPSLYLEALSINQSVPQAQPQHPDEQIAPLFGCWRVLWIQRSCCVCKGHDTISSNTKSSYTYTSCFRSSSGQRDKHVNSVSCHIWTRSSRVYQPLGESNKGQDLVGGACACSKLVCRVLWHQVPLAMVSWVVHVCTIFDQKKAATASHN
jgi:hypothetical protein